MRSPSQELPLHLLHTVFMFGVIVHRDEYSLSVQFAIIPISSKLPIRSMSSCHHLSIISSTTKKTHVGNARVISQRICLKIRDILQFSLVEPLC